MLILDEKARGLGGWTIDVNHDLERSQKTVYLGDGTQQHASNIGTISVIAGHVGLPWACDSISGSGKIAQQANLLGPTDVHALPDGSFLVADTGHRRILKATTDGRIYRIAGTSDCAQGYSGDNGPATNAQLSLPSGIATGPDGSIYIADTWNHVIRRINPEGIIETYAGGGNPADGIGDGGLATDAKLQDPMDLEVSPDGSLYIAERYYGFYENGQPYGTAGRIRKVRKVGSHNIITTIAGGGTKTVITNATPAKDVILFEYTTPSIATVLGTDGSVYIYSACQLFRGWYGWPNIYCSWYRVL